MNRSLLGLCLALLSSFAFAQTTAAPAPAPAPAPASAPKKPAFLSADQLDAASMLPNPPANDSARMAAEVAELHRLESLRTPEIIARAKQDDLEESIFIFKSVLGPKFTREALPATALFSDHVHNDEGIIVNPAKNFFHRPRPYHFDATLKPVCKTKDSKTDYAYPSGHATTGYLEALVLMQMIPEKRDAILERAHEYARNRMVCEAHYPTDLAASERVAYAMVAVMMSNPQFKKELAAAKAETRRALGFGI